MFHTPPHKVGSPRAELTLADYIKRKQDEGNKMISEVDIRDWEKVDFKPFTPDSNGVFMMVDYNTVLKFVEAVQEVYRKQTRNIPKLERKD